VVYPDAQERELDGKRPSQDVFDKMAYDCRRVYCCGRFLREFCSEVNLHAMRLGPGKHLKGLSLFNGLVKPEEVGLVVFFLEMGFIMFLLASSTTSTRWVDYHLGNSKPHSQGGWTAYYHSRNDTNWSSGLFRWYRSTPSCFHHSFPDQSGFSGLLGGGVIGLPPVLNFGSPEMKAKVAQVLI